MIIYTLMPGLLLDHTAVSRPALSDGQTVTQLLLGGENTVTPLMLGLPQACQRGKVNKSVTQQPTLCMSIARERKMPFLLKTNISL